MQTQTFAQQYSFFLLEINIKGRLVGLEFITSINKLA